MKMKKFLLCMTTALFVANTISINAFAAEVNTVEQTQNSEVENTSVTDIDLQGESSTTENQESEQNVTQDTNVETTNDSENKDTESKETESKETTDSTKETTKKETTKSTTKKTTTKKTTTKKKTSTTKKKTTAKTVTTASYTKSELRLLSSLIYCEAGGQSYAGKLAVGIVIVNRMESKAFPDTLKGVVYQKYQFGPVRNGSLAKALKEYDNNGFTSTGEKQCIKAAKAALSGIKTITYKKNGNTVQKSLKGYYYFSGRLSNPRFTLGGHQFK